MKQPPPCWDVLPALLDISLGLIRHNKAGTSPSSQELEEWGRSIGETSYACQGLIVACEDIVELGTTDQRIAAMKSALARAQGQVVYTVRDDRW